MAAIEKRLEAIEKFVARVGGDKGEEEEAPAVFCSFCGKSEHEVHKMIAGHGGAFICDECVLVCVGICMANRTTRTPKKEGAWT